MSVTVVVGVRACLRIHTTETLQAVDRMVTKDRIYFSHIHKAAGSTLCKLAYLNRERTNRGRNCNLPDGLAGALANGSLTEQRRALHLSLDTFVANEMGMPETIYFAPRTLYTTVLRDPEARYVSLASHVQTAIRWHLYGGCVACSRERPHEVPSRWTWDDLRKLSSNRVDRDDRLLRGLLSESEALGFKDNFIVRFFAGPTARAAPEGSLSRAVVQTAFRRLSCFDAVWLLEDLRTPRFTSRAAALFHWRIVDSLGIGRAGLRSGADTSLKRLQKRTRQLMANKSTLDTELLGLVRSANALNAWPLCAHRGTAAQHHTRAR